MPVEEILQDPFDQEIQRISREFFKRARRQAIKSNIDFKQELENIDNRCGIIKEFDSYDKPRDPTQFYKIALHICNEYTPELAYSMTLKLNHFEQLIGFKLYGYTILAIANITSIKPLIQNRILLMKLDLLQKPLFQYTPEAGEIITRAIFMSSINLEAARKVYSIQMCQTIRDVVNNELATIASPDLVTAITNGFVAQKKETASTNNQFNSLH